MIRAIILGALALVCAFVFSLFFNMPSFAAGLHPRCNIDWPCDKTGKKYSEKYSRTSIYKGFREARMPVARGMLISSTSFEAAKINTSRREARRIARGQRLEQAMPFGAPIYPPETQRSFLNRQATILPHPPGCPRRAFCGCGAAVEVFGRPIRSLWLAAR